MSITREDRGNEDPTQFLDIIRLKKSLFLINKHILVLT